MSPTLHGGCVPGATDGGGADGRADGDGHGGAAARRAGWVPLFETDDRFRRSGWTDRQTDLNHTGTTVVAVTTEDAAVLGADRRASLGGRFVSSKVVEKIHRVHPTAALATSGAVGHLQRLTDVLRAETSLYGTRRGEPMSLTALSTLASNVLRSAPLLVTPVLGGVDAAGPRVFALDAGGGRLVDRYTAAGSGMSLAYGVLERAYEEGLAPTEASSLVARAIEAASERDTASGDGLTLATVTRDGVEIDSHDAPAAVA